MEKKRLRGFCKRAMVGVLACTTAFCFMMPLSTHAAVKSGYYTGQALKAYQRGNFKLAKKLFLREPRYHEKCVTNMSAKHLKAYRAVIRKYKKSKEHPLSYNCYTDINKDGHAEMLLQYGTCEADYRTNVYEYYSGGAHCVGKIWSGHTGFACYPNHNGVIAQWEHMEGEAFTIYSLKHHKLYCSQKYPMHDIGPNGEECMLLRNGLVVHNYMYH